MENSRDQRWNISVVSVRSNTNKKNKREGDFYFAVLELERPVPLAPTGLVIGSRFDGDVHSNACRIAFRGVIHRLYDVENYAVVHLPQLKVFKIKHKVRHPGSSGRSELAP